MNETDITLTVNGTDHELSVEPRRLLVHALREDLDLTGTHIGCDTGNCGACTVYQDGEAVKSCLQFAVQADGSEIRTVEGMAEMPGAGEGRSDLHPLQEGFREMHGLQCGFCTPGMIMTGLALLEDHPDPTETEIREGISGNLCRCTGYQNIVKSVEYAADVLNGREPPESPLEGAAASPEPAPDGGSVSGANGTSSEPRSDGGAALGCSDNCACGADSGPGGSNGGDPE